jgi:hypothetical protein
LALGRVPEAVLVYRSLDGDAEQRVVSRLGLGECGLASDTPKDADAHFAAAYAATSDPWYRASALSGRARAAAEGGDVARARGLLAQIEREHPDREDALAQVRAALGVAP